jgi:hypothetical protein
VIEIIVISIYFIMPLAPAGVPGNKAWSWSAVNYAPIALGAVLVLVGGWWSLSARRWFTGPRRTVEEPGPVADPVADTAVDSGDPDPGPAPA